MNAKVSVCLLSWNHEKYIHQCIASLIKQTYKNIEIIYRDNASTDKTFELANQLLTQSSIPYKAYKNVQPLGVSKNLNFLLEKAAGEYIIPLSTDDWLADTCIEEKINYYQQHPNIGMLYSGGWMYFEDIGKFQLVDNSNFKRGRIYKELLLENNVVFFIGCCYKKSVLQEVGNWDDSLLVEDLDMFIRITKRFDIDFIDKPLVYYRKVQTSAANNIDYMVKGWKQYYEKYKNIEGLNMKMWLAKKYREYAAIAIDKKNWKKANQLLKSAYLHNPLDKDWYKTFFYYIRRRISA